MRIGTGYDVHRLTEGRKLIIGGVDIPYEKGLDGHSDADVLTHAIMDALLGAAGLGDIGLHFPDNDPEYKGADSIKLLRRVVDIISENHFVIENVDSTIIAQAPKMRPYIDEMRKILAEAMGLDISQVNVKATTEEHLGFTGEGLGISAQAVALLNTPFDMMSVDVNSSSCCAGGSCPMQS
ncbi:MAG: 2-C-methyl-D-erythritol 2,4-cyclodiphosphate synthase [Lachnospiraceae bacterium]|nr:2-C-methyl-D-erythritol 2,4-cyclodiphosphate synthase [Lachnospiraceae bacterium]